MFGAEAAKTTPWNAFWTNLAQGAVTTLVGQIPGMAPTAPAVQAPIVPGAAAPSTVITVAKSTWPIIAVVGGGIAALVLVLVLKKKRS